MADPALQQAALSADTVSRRSRAVVPWVAETPFGGSEPRPQTAAGPSDVCAVVSRPGLAAIDAVHDGAWGTMVALRSTNIELVALSDAVAQLRTVPVAEYQRYGLLFG